MVTHQKGTWEKRNSSAYLCIRWRCKTIESDENFSGIDIASAECEISDETMDGAFLYKWFNCKIDDLENPFCFQDFIHILTKARNRVLRPSAILPFGNGTVSKTYLKYLIDRVSKDKHGLTATDIDPQDEISGTKNEREESCHEDINNRRQYPKRYTNLHSSRKLHLK